MNSGEGQGVKPWTFLVRSSCRLRYITGVASKQSTPCSALRAPCWPLAVLCCHAWWSEWELCGTAMMAKQEHSVFPIPWAVQHLDCISISCLRQTLSTECLKTPRMVSCGLCSSLHRGEFCGHVRRSVEEKQISFGCVALVGSTCAYERSLQCSQRRCEERSLPAPGWCC